MKNKSKEVNTKQEEGNGIPKGDSKEEWWLELESTLGRYDPNLPWIIDFIKKLLQDQERKIRDLQTKIDKTVDVLFTVINNIERK